MPHLASHREVRHPKLGAVTAHRSDALGYRGGAGSEDWGVSVDLLPPLLIPLFDNRRHGGSVHAPKR